jgi:hypothetical protein
MELAFQKMCQRITATPHKRGVAWSENGNMQPLLPWDESPNPAWVFRLMPGLS